MKITMMDHIVQYFAQQGPDAEMQINLLLDAYVTRRLERDAEEKRFEKACEDAEARAQRMRDRGIKDATAVGPAVMVPSHDMEIGQSLWLPPGAFEDDYP